MSDTGPRLSRYGPAGRREFRRVVLDSLIASTAVELELRNSRRQRLRARSTKRRLDELLQERHELDDDHFTRRTWHWFRSTATGYLVTIVWLAGAALLGLQLALHGVHTRLTIAGDVIMLVLSLIWFLLAVARVPVRTPEDDEPRRSGAPRA